MHAGHAAGQELLGNVHAGKVVGAGLDQVADARLVVATRCQLARQVVAEDGLQFAKTREAKVLGKAHHGRGLHAALARHFLDAFYAHMVAVFFDVQGDHLELLAQGVVFRRNPLDGLVGRGPWGGRSCHGVAWEDCYSLRKYFSLFAKVWKIICIQAKPFLECLSFFILTT